MNWSIPDTPVVGYAWEVAHPVGIILLNHALAEYAQRYFERYNSLIPALMQAGYSVYSYDLRGHGNSPGDIKLVDSFIQVQDHLAARRALRKLHPTLPFYLFAHSAGALHAAGSVMQDQGGIDGVILSSPMLQAGQDQLALIRHLLPIASRLAPSFAIVPIDVSGLSRLDTEIAAYQADLQMYHGKTTLLTASSMLKLSQQLWVSYPAWRVPTLVFYGSADRVSYMDGLPEFVGMLGSADKALHVFPGGYHELLNDLDRNQVLALVQNWLRERLPVTAQPGEKLQAQKARLEKLRSRSLSA